MTGCCYKPHIDCPKGPPNQEAEWLERAPRVSLTLVVSHTVNGQSTTLAAAQFYPNANTNTNAFAFEV
jgi:hypothetical protein